MQNDLESLAKYRQTIASLNRTENESIKMLESMIPRANNKSVDAENNSESSKNNYAQLDMYDPILNQLKPNSSANSLPMVNNKPSVSSINSLSEHHQQDDARQKTAKLRRVSSLKKKKTSKTKRNGLRIVNNEYNVINATPINNIVSTISDNIDLPYGSSEEFIESLSCDTTCPYPVHSNAARNEQQQQVIDRNDLMIANNEYVASKLLRSTNRMANRRLSQPNPQPRQPFPGPMYVQQDPAKESRRAKSSSQESNVLRDLVCWLST